MNNLQRFYKARYETAENYAKAGENEKCLDILWGLRLEPDISLYRRALVNLLIACTADVRKHPDKSKFAQECIDLVAQVRRNGLAEDEDTEKELKRIEAHAEQTLKRIEVEIKEAEAHATAKKSSKKVEDDEDTEADEGTEKSLGEDASKGWTIEGMYTDTKIGSKKGTSK